MRAPKIPAKPDMIAGGGEDPPAAAGPARGCPSALVGSSDSPAVTRGARRRHRGAGRAKPARRMRRPEGGYGRPLPRPAGSRAEPSHTHDHVLVRRVHGVDDRHLRGTSGVGSDHQTMYHHHPPGPGAYHGGGGDTGLLLLPLPRRRSDVAAPGSAGKDVPAGNKRGRARLRPPQRPGPPAKAARSGTSAAAPGFRPPPAPGVETHRLSVKPRSGEVLRP